VPGRSWSLQAELTDAELGAALREHAYLEGDFVLRSGRRSRYYLDKYRFETRPDLLGPLGERIARIVAAHEPEAVRLAGPELGAVPLAAAASLASGLPFLIVRKEVKEYGTGNRLEGVFEPGECVCLVEDVVTSAGAAVAAVEALREAGLTCRMAVCVVDREEGGVDALARVAVRLRPLFRASELIELEKPPQNGMVEPNRRPC
jgi:orotate phosphoribosyltransferase